jgi:hypothetical protein
MVFYFSCKNKSPKVYTSFAEIVVLVTQSTTKLGLQFLDFSMNWYWIYKSLDSRAKLGRIFLCLGPWNIPLHLTPRPSGTNPLHNCTPLPRRGKLAGGEVGPEEANKRGGWAIGLTCARFVMVARAERRPAMAGGEVVAARCRGSGCGEMTAMLGHQARLEAHTWAREELRVTGWSRAQARVRAHQRC